MRKNIDKQITGISGEFFVAAELAKRNFQVSLTLGNAKGVDLFASNQINDIVLLIEVKTLRKGGNCFDLKIERIKQNQIYIFVVLNDENTQPDYYILKGKELLENKEHYYGSSIGKSRETINFGPLKNHLNSWCKLH